MKPSFQAILADYALGLAGTVVGGGATYLLGEWGFRLLAIGTWGAGLMSALAVTALCFGFVIGAGEPIYRRAKRERPHLGAFARKQIWKGAFLGAPTVIALLSVAEMDWAAIIATGHPFLPFRLLILLVGVIQYIATSPARVLVYTMKLPAEWVMMLAAPIGAVLVRHFTDLEAPLPKDQASRDFQRTDA